MRMRLYVPCGWTISSILPEASQSDDNVTKTNLTTISWSHGFY
jgi:hypothetical protein